MNKLYYPKNVGVRSATTNNMKNGNIVNPPTYPEMGGMKPSSFSAGKQKFAKPGPGKKVI